MPINRIQEKLAGRDIQASRQHLSQALSRCGDSIVPLVELMKKEVLDSGVIFTDETPVKLQQKKKCKEGRVWVYGGGKPPNGSKNPPYLVYQFTDGRSYDYPKKYLETFSGILHADAYGVYEQLDKDLKKDIFGAACWAHARREFLKAINLSAEFKRWILRKVRYLFMFERLAWKGDAERRLFIRDRYERPIVSEIYARLKQEALKPIHLPRSKAGKAINYMLKREKNFTLYLDHAPVHMDNNISERALRKIAVGRKNWLFFGSEQAAEKQMGLLSLIQTCRNLGIKPQEYLEDIFSRILTHPASRLEELLPDRWKAMRDEQPSKEM